MNRELVKELIDFLAPHMDTPARRRGWLYPALSGSPVVNQIDWEGDARAFSANLINTLQHYGNWPPDKPSLVTLLEYMRSELGADRQALIDRLISDVRSEALSPGSSSQRSMLPIILGIGAVIVVAALLLVNASGLFAPPPTPTATPTDTPTLTPTLEPSATLEPTDAFTATFTSAPPSNTPTDTPTDAPTSTPTDTPTSTTPPPAPPTTAPTVATAATQTGVSLSLSRDRDLFVIYAPQNPLAGLGNIAFRYTIGDTTRTTRTLNSFPAFGLDFGALTQPACFVFRLQGDNTPLPMDCQSSGTLVFTQSLANADVFWRDGFGQSLTLLVMQGDTQIGLCAAGNVSCAVEIADP